MFREKNVPCQENLQLLYVSLKASILVKLSKYANLLTARNYVGVQYKDNYFVFNCGSIWRSVQSHTMLMPT